MQFVDVTADDVRFCQNLIKAIQSARFDCSGAEATALGDTIRGVQNLGLAVGKKYQEQEAAKAAAPVPDTGLKIKNMGTGG